MNFDRPPAPAAPTDAAPVLVELVRELHSLRGAAGLLIVAQAAMQAVAGALAVGLAVNLYGHWASPVRWALFAFGALLALLIRLGVVAWDGYRERAMYMTESITQPPAADAPQLAPVRTVRVELVDRDPNGGVRQMQFLDLPYPDRLPVLAAGLSNGVPFTIDEWAGKDKLFSQGEFDILRDEMRARGLAVNRNPAAPNLGMTLTVAGKAVMRKIAGGMALPSPAGSVDE